MTRPMPPETAVLNYKAEFMPEEFDKISQGLKPQQMEDKWLIEMEGDTLSFCRSWTGHCIFRVEFAGNGGRYAVRSALANRNAEQYNSPGDDYDAALLGFLIEVLLLGRDGKFPVPGKKFSGGLFQHAVAGTGCPEKPIRKKPWWKFR